MKHLYIIGNGFDIYTGLATRYSDFRLWLENNYPFFYENLQAVYDIDAEWWNNFELQPTQVQGVLEICRLLFLNKHHHIDWNVSNLLFY